MDELSLTKQMFPCIHPICINIFTSTEGSQKGFTLTRFIVRNKPNIASIFLGYTSINSFRLANPESSLTIKRRQRWKKLQGPSNSLFYRRWKQIFLLFLFGVCSLWERLLHRATISSGSIWRVAFPFPFLAGWDFLGQLTWTQRTQ